MITNRYDKFWAVSLLLVIIFTSCSPLYLQRSFQTTTENSTVTWNADIPQEYEVEIKPDKLSLYEDNQAIVMKVSIFDTVGNWEKYFKNLREIILASIAKKEQKVLAIIDDFSINHWKGLRFDTQENERFWSYYFLEKDQFFLQITTNSLSRDSQDQIITKLIQSLKLLSPKIEKQFDQTQEIIFALSGKDEYFWKLKVPATIRFKQYKNTSSLLDSVTGNKLTFFFHSFPSSLEANRYASDFLDNCEKKYDIKKLKKKEHKLLKYFSYSDGDVNNSKFMLGTILQNKTVIIFYLINQNNRPLNRFDLEQANKIIETLSPLTKVI